jgi:flavin reductase (DIM6/NTAB) family NADH-FMN oxidoreductase RutF
MLSFVPSSYDYPSGVSEFEALHLKTVPSIDVKPPRLKDALVAMDCKVTQIVPVEGATNVMVLGKVVRFHVQEELYRPAMGLVDTHPELVAAR